MTDDYCTSKIIEMFHTQGEKQQFRHNRRLQTEENQKWTGKKWQIYIGKKILDQY